MKRLCCLMLIFLSGCTSPLTDLIVAAAELPIKIPIALISGTIKLAKQAFGSSKEDELHTKNIVGKDFELQQDVFLFKSPDGCGCFIKNDRDSSKFPADLANAPILGVVKKGTSLRIIEINRKKDSYNIQAEFKSSEWRGIFVNVGDFFKVVNDLSFEPFNYFLQESE